MLRFLFSLMRAKFGMNIFCRPKHEYTLYVQCSRLKIYDKKPPPKNGDGLWSSSQENAVVLHEDFVRVMCSKGFNVVEQQQRFSYRGLWLAVVGLGRRFRT
jgi:hypothetical protein